MEWSAIAAVVATIYESDSDLAAQETPDTPAPPKNGESCRPLLTTSTSEEDWQTFLPAMEAFGIGDIMHIEIYEL